MMVVNKNKDKYEEIISKKISNITPVFVSNLDKAIKFITEVDWVAIDHTIIETSAYTIQDLQRYRKKFGGKVIVKVSEELDGIKLLKTGLVDEFYLENPDPDEEVKSFLRVFEVVLAKQKLKISLGQLRENLVGIQQVGRLAYV